MKKNKFQSQKVRVNEQSKHSSLKTELEWLDTVEAAYYLRTKPSVIRNQSSNGRLPYYKNGRKNLYRKSDLREHLLKNKRGGSYGN